MCRFGCDELYERGCLSVQNGRITFISKSIVTQTVLDYVKSIDGTKCSVFNPTTKKYFDWHWQLNMHVNAEST